MLKLKLDKAAFDALEDATKSFYKADGDSYSLQVDGLGDLEKKAKKHDIEVEHRKNAESKAKELETQIDTLKTEKSDLNIELEKAKAGGADGKSLEDLENSYNAKLEQEIAKIRKEEVEPLKADNERLTNNTNELMVTSKAQEIAASIAVDSTTSPFLAEKIATRLKIETDGDKLKTVVLDKEGKLSASTFEELGNEFNTDPQFARLVKGNQSSGSGANGGENNGNNSGANNQPITAEEAAKTGDIHGFISSNLNL